MNTVRSEDAPGYLVVSADEDAIIERALRILEGRHQPGALMGSPDEVMNYLLLRAVGHDREVFGCLWLDSQNRILVAEDVFFGTLTQTSVYPRELARRALQINAAAVILTHNHPSGEVRPSRADETITRTIKSTLALVDVRVLDHIITGAASACSMAGLGLI